MNEAELLFTSLLGCNRLSLYLEKETILDKARAGFVAKVLKRRITGEPIQYILGEAEFMGLKFKVTPDVLIPRPETEILVEKTIELASRFKSHVSSPNILDVGTGSGNIAISLAKFLPNANITAMDISEEALEVARCNAQSHNVYEKISFIRSDVFTWDLGLGTWDKSYDLIVSNPPYIPGKEIERLQPEVRFEPRIALDAGADGLDFYRKISAVALDYLREGSLLIMEMGFGQEDALKNILQNQEDFEIIETVKDYNNINRVIVARKKR